MFIGFTDEEDFPIIWRMGVRVEDEYCFFLCDAGEVEEIVVLFEGQGGICVGGEDVV